MAFKFKKVSIIGMGLMGGSLGALLLKKKIARGVTGVGRNMKRLKLAVKMKAATSVTTDLIEGVKDADLVIISVPVMLIPVMFMEMKDYLKKGAIVTDMGSVKGPVCDKIAKLDAKRCFVGSHPMVGSEKTGIKNMKEDMYKGGVCIVTPGAKTDKKKAAAVAALWKKIGMTVKIMAPQEHDSVIAGLSHMPHLLAFAMVNTQAKKLEKYPDAAGRGFKDTTRIGASGEEIWSEIFVMNKKEVLRGIDAMMDDLRLLRGMVEYNSMQELKGYIKKARKMREGLK
jgi:prephenate dehydrogenase